MLYGTFYVRYFEGTGRIEKRFGSLNEAADFWELVDDPTAVVLDENHAFVDHEDLLRVA